MTNQNETQTNKNIKHERVVKMNNNYNGWSNYETWNFMLWYGEQLHDTIEWNEMEGDEVAIEGMIRDLIDEQLDSINNNGFVIDMFTRAIELININEILETLLDN